MKFVFLFMLVFANFANAVSEPDPFALINCGPKKTFIYFELFFRGDGSIGVQNAMLTPETHTRLSGNLTEQKPATTANSILPFSEITAQLENGDQLNLISSDGENYTLQYQKMADKSERQESCEIIRTKPGVIISN